MESHYLKELILSENAAILCKTGSEVHLLADMVEKLFPSYGQFVRNRASWLHVYPEGICVRIDRIIDTRHLDIGHSSYDWYKAQGRLIVKFNELSDHYANADFGEFETNDAGMSSLLFGGI